MTTERIFFYSFSKWYLLNFLILIVSVPKILVILLIFSQNEKKIYKYRYKYFLLLNVTSRIRTQQILSSSIFTIFALKY